ncbi:GlsB/YeaQ/YmgE family stress response membrane protein [Leptolyngbya sp. FACHB-17]|uniref:GlsB/YeaQ/YmgE family stress response membrane protein n=1 Tax=unclassified Leptolyngbya TaxID=2650499 RepID=UPI001680AB4D|nr:GlsB/YeaQ/YmgE family stress response membrane protein [Leptolyngbya sp. FACHB-17]MBD2081868.1 GlsB/YeaQ/YmgE family stress response membrane protein [Leptolyngbya sp. FACHB-17]
MNIIAWAVLGIVAGAIAKLLYPGRQGGGIFTTMILGIIGSFLGGSLYTLLTKGTISLTATGFSLPGLLVAVLGAMIAIFLWGLVTRSAA